MIADIGLGDLVIYLQTKYLKPLPQNIAVYSSIVKIKRTNKCQSCVQCTMSCYALLQPSATGWKQSSANHFLSIFVYICNKPSIKLLGMFE